jgi:hypothetical protein
VSFLVAVTYKVSNKTFRTDSCPVYGSLRKVKTSYLKIYKIFERFCGLYRLFLGCFLMFQDIKWGLYASQAHFSGKKVFPEIFKEV